ncbi:hypothetical protein RSAG8_00854, partial [Rhizoctonia solani AG-8 WAC10335]
MFFRKHISRQGRTSYSKHRQRERRASSRTGFGIPSRRGLVCALRVGIKHKHRSGSRASGGHLFTRIRFYAPRCNIKLHRCGLGHGGGFTCQHRVVRTRFGIFHVGLALTCHTYLRKVLGHTSRAVEDHVWLGLGFRLRLRLWLRR